MKVNMKVSIYYIVVVHLIIFNSVFVLAKHNYIKSHIPQTTTIEEEIALQLSFLDVIDKSLDQAQPLENGNYQVQLAGSWGILALIAYTLNQLQKIDPSDRRILDQARQFVFKSRFIGFMDASSLRPLTGELTQALNNAEIALYSERNDNVRIYNKSTDLLEAFEGHLYDPHPPPHSNDHIRITPEGKTHVDITYEPIQHRERLFVINSSRGTVKQDLSTGLLSYADHTTTTSFDNFGQATTNAINSSPARIIKKLRIPHTIILPIGLSFVSLLFANDTEADENGQLEVSPVEITPEDFEQIQNDINTAKDSLFSLL